MPAADDARMRILTAPHRVALEAHSPVTIDLVVHNDCADDGVVFPTLVVQEDVATATFDPPLGFLAAGTAQRFRVQVFASGRGRAQTAAEWVIFAEGRVCERRACELISFEPASAAREMPAPTIDPQRKAQILALAGDDAVPGRARAFSVLAVGAALLCVLACALGLQWTQRVPRAVAAPPRVLRLPPPAIPRITRRMRAPRLVVRVPKPPAAATPLPRAVPPVVRVHRPRTLAAHVRSGSAHRVRASPPLLVSIDAPPQVHAANDLMIGVASLRATSVRIAVKLGPVVLIERTTPASAAGLTMRAPDWAGHTQLLTVRVWVKNASASASGYATVAIVP